MSGGPEAVRRASSAVWPQFGEPLDQRMTDIDATRTA